MRIALVIANLAAGGAERVISNLANAFVARGDRVWLVTLGPVGDDRYPLSPQVERVGLDVLGESRSVWAGVIANLRRLRRLRGVLRELDADAVVAMMSRVSVLTLLATRGLGMRVVVSERTHPPQVPLGRWWEWLRRKTYPWAESVVMLTPRGADWLAAAIPRARGTVVPNAIVTGGDPAEPVVCPGQWLDPDRRVLLAAGRLVPEKGFDALLEAFARVHEAHPDWQLVILGEGGLRTELVERIRALGLEAAVRLPGWVGNMDDWYERADLFVLSSRFEGFPSVVGEAMAHGVPAVSFDCDTGPRELIRPGVDGLLVAPGDVDALAAALGDVMGDVARRTAFASRAREVAERFALDRVVALWMRVLEE